MDTSASAVAPRLPSGSAAALGSAGTEARSGAAPSVAEVTRRLTAPGMPHEIVTVDVRGRPTRVWRQAPATIREVVEGLRRHGELTYLVYEAERLSYAEAYRQVAAFAHASSAEYGIARGERVAIAARNLPEWVLAFWAAASVGAIVVPLNAWWTREELLYALRDSGAKLLVADVERLERLGSELPALGARAILIGGAAGASQGWQGSPGSQGSQGSQGWQGSQGSQGAVESFASVVARHLHGLGEVRGPGGSLLPELELAADDDATLFYTSGTTGHPKGALGTHRNFCTNLLSGTFTFARAALRAGAAAASPPTEQKTTLISVPFFHVTGCHSILGATTAAGGKLVMMYRWDTEQALRLIERERVNTFGGVPSVVWQVVESPDFGRYDTSSVERVRYGGAPAPPELVRRIAEAFPRATAANGYGMTETSAITCTNSGVDYQDRPESVGPAVPVCEVRVVDDEGRPLPLGEVGELCIFGPNIVRGYWNQPEATRETFIDGWLRTGDVARVDAEGFVYILDRKKDMLIRGGENIYCVEVEDALYTHPSVMDAAVFGVPHAVLGEEPAAVVQLVPGAVVGEQELREHVRSRLAAYKVPIRIRTQTAPLARNASGKILKRELVRDLATPSVVGASGAASRG